MHDAIKGLSSIFFTSDQIWSKLYEQKTHNIRLFTYNIRLFTISHTT